jgi:7-cyano-7-deazaguanine synthase
MAKKALVLMSGGLDSATCLYWAKDKFDEVQAITFNYFERIQREKTATHKITKLANVNLIEVKIPFIKEKSKYSDFKRRLGSRASQSYIPLRNLIFYSISGYFAQVNKIRNIVGGHNASDGNIFKDATTPYFRRMNELIIQGLLGPVDCKIILPLKQMSRLDIIRLAMALNVPIRLTWSCHRNGKVQCGECYACKQRLNAFKFLTLTDPAPYYSHKPSIPC